MVKLFEIKNGQAFPTTHCYAIGYLKDIIEEYGDINAGKIFTFFHYMWDLNPDENPFANLPENEKEEHIVRNICPEIDTDVELIQESLELVGKLYETPTYNVYKGFKIAMDRLAEALHYVRISLDKEDGNVNQVKLANATYRELKEGYKEAFQAYQDEMKTIVSKGGGKRSYDSGKQEELE